ncbi:MAG: fumarylacetoacetate hydrolase family protein [Alphaproteobacteria bacterium]|nr:fumarylacetoacetate hydrolase family protein [Alphaproteobacteria bacterium]
MKFVTFGALAAPRLGALDAERGVLDLKKANSRLPGDMVALIEGGASALKAAKSTFEAARKKKGGPWTPLNRAKLLAPFPSPRKNVFCVGRNYKLHILEGARARGVEPTFPKVPEFFSKPRTTVIGHDASILRHEKDTQQLDYEVELAVVIGKRIRDVPEDKAMAAVFGYTICNDVTARDLQRAHGQWFKGKSLDTFCPMGPCIVTADEFGDPSGHRISLKVNGEIRQDSNTSDLLFGVPALVSSLCAGLTLEPGDVISTGTPSGVAMGMTPQMWLQVGDVIEAEIEGIGVLRDRVVKG